MLPANGGSPPHSRCKSAVRVAARPLGRKKQPARARHNRSQAGASASPHTENMMSSTNRSPLVYTFRLPPYFWTSILMLFMPKP